NGDKETGVSIIDIAEKLDAGDIYFQEKIAIGPRTDAAELASELARFSYGILKKVLAQVKDGQLRGTPQNEATATLAPQLSKKDGELSLTTMTAEAIDRKVRGLQPWPGAYCFIKSERIALLKTELPLTVPSPDDETREDTSVTEPGTLLAIEKEGGIQVSTKDGALKILEVKPEGKKPMTAADFVRGRRLGTGEILREK
ncbi:MAG: formyltransferase family protein, partial [Candidatus Omnitrophica bacterium]|nr:formyltransferase family protein [Candidatus Omnitrophota bacterium]